jgi:hypothetical protein
MIASLTMPVSAIVGFSGLLNSSGMAFGSLALPNDPGLINLNGYVAFVTVDFNTGIIRGISNAARFTVGP